MKSLVQFVRERKHLAVGVILALSVPTTALATFFTTLETNVLSAYTRVNIGSANTFLNGTTDWSLAVGYANYVSAVRSLAIGSSNVVTSHNSLVVGVSNVITSASEGSIVGGKYCANFPGLIMALGNGTGTAPAQRSNAFEVYQDGTVEAPSRLIVNDNQLSTGDALTVRLPGSNSLRVKADGTVLVRRQGNIDMGTFTAGEAP